MAATEYYMGTAAAQQLQGQDRWGSYQQPRPQPQQSQPRPHDYASQLQPYPPPPAPYSPHPQASQVGPQGYPLQPQLQQQNGYLGAPLQPQRSHSQPSRVRFAEQDEYGTDSGRLYASDGSSPHRRHKRRHHRHHRSHDRDYDRDYDRDLRAAHEKSHKDRDTFLGAGGGAVIGDAIFPGLGTFGGMLLGGYGGRKHAVNKERSRRETADREEYHSDGDGSEGNRYRRGRGRRDGGNGWDEASATYKKGLAVR